jgi:hypothetical protein
VLGACSGGGSDDKASSTTKKSSTTTTSPARFTVGAVHVESAGPDVKLDAKTQQGVVAIAQRYVDAAVVGPLRTGAVAKNYAGLFDLHVEKPATTSDREALTDASVGKATKGYSVRLSPVRIDALADQTGNVIYMSASFQTSARTTVPTGPMNISRSTELTLAREGPGWKVTAYRVVATRRAQTGTTTTSAQTATTAKP